jgi:hypothetical protein
VKSGFPLGMTRAFARHGVQDTIGQLVPPGCSSAQAGHASAVNRAFGSALIARTIRDEAVTRNMLQSSAYMSPAIMTHTRLTASRRAGDSLA